MPPTIERSDNEMRDRLAVLGPYHTDPPLDHRIASASCDLCREAREIKRALGLED
jgi:hypothetical protein